MELENKKDLSEIKKDLWLRFFTLIMSIGFGFIKTIYFKDMWSWFVVPLGVVSLSYWHAYGLLVFISMIQQTVILNKTSKEDCTETIAKFIAATILYFILMFVHTLM